MRGGGRRLFRFQPGQSFIDFPEVVFDFGELFGFSFLLGVSRALPLTSAASSRPNLVSIL